MYMLCEKLHVLPNGGGLLEQTPANVERIRILHQVRDERARAKEKQEEMKAKSGRKS